jgi:hypothetical protein
MHDYNPSYMNIEKGRSWLFGASPAKIRPYPSKQARNSAIIPGIREAEMGGSGFEANSRKVSTEPYLKNKLKVWGHAQVVQCLGGLEFNP